MGTIIVGVHHVQTTTTVLHKKDLSYCVKGCFCCSALFEANTKLKKPTQTISYTFYRGKRNTSLLNTMEAKKVFIFGAVLLFSLISFVTGMPMFGESRMKRSPQSPVSPWCKTAFLNFPRFTPR